MLWRTDFVGLWAGQGFSRRRGKGKVGRLWMHSEIGVYRRDLVSVAASAAAGAVGRMDFVVVVAVVDRMVGQMGWVAVAGSAV